MSRSFGFMCRCFALCVTFCFMSSLLALCVTALALCVVVSFLVVAVVLEWAGLAPVVFVGATVDLAAGVVVDFVVDLLVELADAPAFGFQTV